MNDSSSFWGFHLILDMAYCNSNVNDEKMIGYFVKTLIDKIDMIPIGEPIIAKIDNEYEKGISILQLITTSTISLHTDLDKMAVYLDVFSCKLFDPKDVVTYTQSFFEPKILKQRWFYRDATKDT